MTGSVVFGREEMAIKNGKLLGDQVTFTIDIPAGLSNGFTMLFEGQAGENEIRLTARRESPDIQQEFVVKRAN